MFKRGTLQVSVGLLIASFLFSRAAPCLAVSKDDPEVQAVLNKAVQFLEETNATDANSSKLGAQCLTAMAIMQHRKNLQHPKVQAALQACQAVAQNTSAQYPTDFNYSLGIAIIFMCELEGKSGEQYKYKDIIVPLYKMMASRQRQDGAWSYPNHPTGDTSQTQYGALSTWVANSSSYEVDLATVDSFANWLIRTQDPSGEFAYQGTDPGHYNRVEQPSRTEKPDAAYRMSPAALGALYVAARLREIPLVHKSDDLFEKAGSTASSIEVDNLKRAIREGNAKYDATFKIDVANNYQFYYLYSVERYYTLRYEAEGKEVPEPAWYTQGFEYLKKNQQSDGSWTDQTGPISCTAFGALFLLRATKELVQLEKAGVVRGGYGLPSDLTNITQVGGQIVSNEAAGDISELLKMIREGEVPDARAATDAIDKVMLGNARKVEPSQVEELKKLIAGEGEGGNNYVARLAAVRTLANASDINNAPVLIYALGDGDPRVAREANDGLRLLSKRFGLVTLPSEPSNEQKRLAQQTWYNWLKSVRPDLEVPEDAFLEIASQ